MSEGHEENQAATASYIEDMLTEMVRIGRNINCDFLVFLLEMARLEAVNIQRNGPTPGRQPNLADDSSSDLNAEQLVALFMRLSKNKH